jgi:hypothetical protein
MHPRTRELRELKARMGWSAKIIASKCNRDVGTVRQWLSSKMDGVTIPQDKLDDLKSSSADEAPQQPLPWAYVDQYGRPLHVFGNVMLAWETKCRGRYPRSLGALYTCCLKYGLDVPVDILAVHFDDMVRADRWTRLASLESDIESAIKDGFFENDRAHIRWIHLPSSDAPSKTIENIERALAFTLLRYAHIPMEYNVACALTLSACHEFGLYLSKDDFMFYFDRMLDTIDYRIDHEKFEIEIGSKNLSPSMSLARAIARHKMSIAPVEA